MSKNRFTFPVGYHDFHKVKIIDFQLDRWYSLGYARFEDIFEPRITRVVASRYPDSHWCGRPFYSSKNALQTSKGVSKREICDGTHFHNERTSAKSLPSREYRARARRDVKMDRRDWIVKQIMKPHSHYTTHFESFGERNYSNSLLKGRFRHLSICLGGFGLGNWEI